MIFDLMMALLQWASDNRAMLTQYTALKPTS